MNSPRLLLGLLGTLLMFALSGCHYSMSAGGIDYNKVKSISIYNFPNESGSGPAYLSQRFSEKMREYWQNNTKLIQLKSGGDWEIEGTIVGYKLEPIAPQANQTAGQNRLTITVKVTFINNKPDPELDEQDEANGFVEKQFNWYANFPQNESLSQNEQALIESISDQIIQDIYVKLTSNDF